MPVILVLLVIVPLVAVTASAVLPRRAAEVGTAVSGVVVLALSITLVPAVSEHTVTAGPYLRADALSAVFLLATGFLYAVTAVYSIGYHAQEARVAAADPEQAAEFARYCRRFNLGLNVFAWSLVCAPLVNGLALLWVAVEITTVVSALLVALDDTERAAEAAWKYVLIASSGLGVALLATIVMYYAGAQTLGQSYDLAFDPLLGVAARLPSTAVQLALVLAVVGFGMKVGLVPITAGVVRAHGCCDLRR